MMLLTILVGGPLVSSKISHLATMAGVVEVPSPRTVLMIVVVLAATLVEVLSVVAAVVPALAVWAASLVVAVSRTEMDRAYLPVH